MKHNTIPWFVFNNRTTREPSHDVVQERRAAVLTVCFMAMLIALVLLAAAYCKPALITIVTILSLIGTGTLFRAVYRYTKGA